MKIIIMSLFCIVLSSCYSIDKGTTTIIPVNVAKNGMFCGTLSVTAARYMPAGYIVNQNNNSSLKYTADSEKIFNKLKANIGKETVVEYNRDWFYINPCIKNEYVITKVKESSI